MSSWKVNQFRYFWSGFEFSGRHIAEFIHGLVFEAVNLSGMVWALWLSPAEWNLVSSERSFVLVLSLCASYFLKAAQTQKTNFVCGAFPYVRNHWWDVFKFGEVCARILREAKWRKWEKETLGRASTWRKLCLFKGNCCVGTWYASLLPLDRFTAERRKLNSFSCSFEAKSVWLVQPLNGV